MLVALEDEIGATPYLGAATGLRIAIDIIAALPVVEPAQVSSLWSDPEFLRSYAQSIEYVRDGVTPRGLVTSDEIDGLLSGALPVLETKKEES
jgi:hypothetical protein